MSEYHKNWYLKNKERIKALRAEYRKEHKDVVLSSQKKFYQKTKINNPKRLLLWSAKARAKKRGLDFSISEASFEVPEFCPILGIAISTEMGKWSDHSPSLDRIDPSLGYIEGNVHVVSWRANMLKSNGSLEEFELIIKWMKENNKNE